MHKPQCHESEGALTIPHYWGKWHCGTPTTPTNYFVASLRRFSLQLKNTDSLPLRNTHCTGCFHSAVVSRSNAQRVAILNPSYSAVIWSWLSSGSAVGCGNLLQTTTWPLSLQSLPAFPIIRHSVTPTVSQCYTTHFHSTRAEPVHNMYQLFRGVIR